MNRDYYAGMTEGRIKERERIIKLLETEFYDDEVNMESMLVNYSLVIAILKGEK